MKFINVKEKMVNAKSTNKNKHLIIKILLQILKLILLNLNKKTKWVIKEIFDQLLKRNLNQRNKKLLPKRKNTDNLNWLRRTVKD